MDGRLRRVVEAVSDGEPIDWAAVRRRFADPKSGDYCTHLETVSAIGRLAPPRDAAHAEVREPPWVVCVLAVAAVQIALGIVGFLVYRPYSYINALRLLTVLAFAGVGLVLRQNRENVRARHLGAVFLLTSFGFSRAAYGTLVDAWEPSAGVASLLRTGFAVDAWSPYFIWQFVRRFPATVRFTTIDRTAIAFTNVVGAIGTALFAVNLWAVLTHPATGVAATFALNHEEGQRFSATLFALKLPALPLLVVRARSALADERRRVWFFVVAMIVGTAPMSLEVILEALIPSYTAFLRASDAALTVMVTMVVGPMLALPFVTAYAVLVHRLLEVRVAVRHGVRYLLARWTLAGLTATPFTLLAVHVYARRNDSIVAVVSDGRGIVLMAMVALGCTLLASRTFLMTVLDRWFDRRGIDRSSVLARAGERFRLVRTRSELVVVFTEAAESALNAPTSVYWFDERRGAYVPWDRSGPRLSAESALVTVLMQEPSLAVLRTDGTQSLARFLPALETRWLADSNACAIAPIRHAGAERPAALIAFGPRRDAIRYSRDDERFVAALASATGIALDNLRLKAEAVRDDEGNEFGTLCPRCRRVDEFVEGQRTCTCGGELQAASVPRQISGKFRVDSLLGAGGMGVVYLANDVVLHRPVALKTLPTVSAEAMTRLGREARTMAALSHPNLAMILGQESWRGTPILVCEYLPGGTLQQKIISAPLGVDETLMLGLTLLDALGYMHSHGVLHRDVKPSNVAFTIDNIPKLLDFGLTDLFELARSTSDATAPPWAVSQASGLAGTLAYLPPQAFDGAAPSAAFDLWALAVVLFESIVGRHPFASGSETTHNICRGKFVVPMGDTTPRVVSEFLRRALNPSADRQFHSARAMRDALMATRAASANEGPANAR